MVVDAIHAPVRMVFSERFQTIGGFGLLGHLDCSYFGRWLPWVCLPGDFFGAAFIFLDLSVKICFFSRLIKQHPSQVGFLKVLSGLDLSPVALRDSFV